MKRQREAERTNGQGRSASKTAAPGHDKSDIKTELRSESSKDEAAAEDLETAKGEFATNLETARVLWQRYPDLVESPQFPEPFLKAFRKREQREPDGPEVECWDGELLAAGILPKPAKLRFNKEALNEEIRIALEDGFDRLATHFAEGASAEELGIMTAILNRHGGSDALQILNDLLLCGQEGATS